MKAVTKWESSIARTAMDLFVICELFKDTVVVFQQMSRIDEIFAYSLQLVLFERLATPRPAPKVTLKRSWQTQQQPQLPKLGDDTQSIWKQRASRESRAGVRDDTKQATEGRATRQLVLPTSAAKDDTHLTVTEELTDPNAKDIERIKVGSNKICIREDLVNEKMVFSKESSQAMGNVELIELKKPTIQCPSCLHHEFGGTFLCNCGKY